ncbi:hypothetical protein CEUSTIGMA_g9488.t1 [Chlamydomonas eustigma]|uniref:Uncharacterized protein n=1 Tax=Chlamydomonas eustigma TaxID=1157962 RepID=A0A250XGZ2_9CHLO|nr:hypothetical protein CEUSTIGMA_g9488.t1 [Chlamydomonas eustigma]|eukprot:GAX82060.1 hypothetical protein CEUSTIGMA_g9488.t1 [Chlamydomonas eustigma]
MGDRSNSVFYAKNLKRPLHFQNNLPAQDPLVRDLMTDIKGFSSVGGNNAPARDTNIQTEKSQFDPHGENEGSPADRPEHETVMTVVSQGMSIGVAVYDRYKRAISVAQFLDYTPVAVHNQQGTHEGSFSTLQTVKLQAVRSLDALNIEGISFPSSRHERLLKLNTLLDLSKELQISALGALIQFMLKVRTQA